MPDGDEVLRQVAVANSWLLALAAQEALPIAPMVLAALGVGLPG